MNQYVVTKFYGYKNSTTKVNCTHHLFNISNIKTKANLTSGRHAADNLLVELLSSSLTAATIGSTRLQLDVGSPILS